MNYDGLQVSDYGTYQKDAAGWCLQATEATSSVTSTYQWITASGCSAPGSLNTIFTPYVAGQCRLGDGRDSSPDLLD